MDVVAYFITIGISAVFFMVSWRRPAAARWLFFALFFLAACLNLYLAIQNPGAYQYFAEVAWVNFYRIFITGWLSANTTWFINGVAACQLLISLSMFGRGFILRIGCAAAVCFLLSIAPLGIGSAFPSTLIMAAGMAFVFRWSLQSSTTFARGEKETAASR